MGATLIKLILLVTLMVVSGCGGGGGGGGSAEVDAKLSYFPMTVGSTWTSSSDDGLTRTEILADGRIKTQEADGSISYANVITDNNAALLTKIMAESGDCITTGTYSPAVILIPSDTTLGSVTTSSSNVTYNFTGCSNSTTSVKFIREITVIGKETVSVEAGIFSALKLKYKDTFIASNGYTSTYTGYQWFSQGIGPVKSISSDGSISELVSSNLIASVPLNIAVSPSTVSVSTNGNTIFSATVTSASNTAVTWSVVESGGGSITSSGVYTAPSRAGTYHVKATSVADPTKSATATVTVTAIAPFPIGTWVGPHNTIIRVNALGETFGSDKYYSGSVSYPAFQGGSVTIPGNIINSSGTILYQGGYAFNVTAGDPNLATMFTFSASDITSTSTLIGILVIVSSVQGYSYSETATFVKQ